MYGKQRVALLVGAGDAGGCAVCIGRRRPEKSGELIGELKKRGQDVHAFGVDARSETDVQKLFADVEERVGPVDVCLFNAGSNVNKPLDKLAATADVLVQNFRPGAMTRLGLGPEQLRKRYPRLIYVSISGVGDSGPYAKKRVYDPIVQALSGFCDIQAQPQTNRPQMIARSWPTRRRRSLPRRRYRRHSTHVRKPAGATTSKWPCSTR
jgi:NAD(P)-dependent dehydrogenase (short-subunit alcohol dehydrogenase family)